MQRTLTFQGLSVNYIITQVSTYAALTDWGRTCGRLIASSSLMLT
jgi:hypothetical protein